MRFLTRRVPSRRLQGLPQYPVAAEKTQDARAYPVWEKPQKAHRVEFKRRLQRLDDRIVAPLSPKDPSLDVVPQISKQTGHHRVQFGRRVQNVPPPHVFPATTPNTEYPAWEPPKAHRSRFERRVQPILRPHVFPPTPVGIPFPVALLREPPELVKRNKRNLFTEITVTSVIFNNAVYPAEHPAHVPPPTFRTRFKRKSPQQPQVLPAYPASPANIYPAWAGTKAHRIDFLARRRLDTLKPHVFPATTQSDYPAWAGTEAIRRRETRRKLLKARLDRYFSAPPTQPHAAFEKPSANRIEHRRKLLRAPDLAAFLPREASAAEYAAWIPPKRHRVEFTRTLQKLPQLRASPPTETPEDWPAWQPPKTFQKRHKHRHLTAIDAPVKISDKGDQGYQGWVEPKTFHTSFRRTRLTLVEAPVKIFVEPAQKKDLVIFRASLRGVQQTVYLQTELAGAAYTSGDIDGDGTHTHTTFDRNMRWHEDTLLGIVTDLEEYHSGGDDIDSDVYTQSDFDVT